MCPYMGLAYSKWEGDGPYDDDLTVYILSRFDLDA